ncbi:MAG TPA: pentapeptide repeat-containing protein, partial [Thermosynechococcaceae cyanobacterium]
ANLSLANLSGVNLSLANLSEASLNGVNLSLANLSEAVVVFARFEAARGISEESKRDLIQRGAIFEDAPGDRSEVPTGR